MEDIEKGIDYQDIRTMLSNEHGRSNYNAITDMQLCHDIDMAVIPAVGKKSIYELSEEDKKQIGQHLLRKYHVPIAQIYRCLGMTTSK